MCNHLCVCTSISSINYLGSKLCFFVKTEYYCDISRQCLVRPIMEYACTIWLPHTAKNINILERVQLRAARWAAGSRWVPSSCHWSKSSEVCLKELQWPPIHQRHKYFSICQVHDIFHNRNSISFSDYFHLSTVRSLNIRPVLSSINSFRFSFLLTARFCGMQFHLKF